jgi:hypothetical protein
LRCTDCDDCTAKKLKPKSFSLILINFIRSDRFRFGPTDFHGLSDRMSDTFFKLSGSLVFTPKIRGVI